MKTISLLKVHRFYCRAMLCISAALAVMRWLSMCMSRSYILSKRMKHILELPRGSQAILAFLYQTAWQYSHGTPPPPNGASNAGGVGRNRDSEPVSGFAASCQCCDRPQPGQVLSKRRRRASCDTYRCGGVSWWQDATTKCLWQEVSKLRRRQQSSI